MRPSVRSLWLFTVMIVLATSRNVVAGGCTVRASGIKFGSYNSLEKGPARSVGTVTYHCLSHPSAGIKIIMAGEQVGTAGVRFMTAGSNRLAYLLCLDPNCLRPWGADTNGTALYYESDPPLDTDVTIHVYGLVPQGQSAAANRVYQDSVAVRAEF